jgi:hypothetical protein
MRCASCRLAATAWLLVALSRASVFADVQNSHSSSIPRNLHVSSVMIEQAYLRMYGEEMSMKNNKGGGKAKGSGTENDKTKSNKGDLKGSKKKKGCKDPMLSSKSGKGAKGSSSSKMSKAGIPRKSSSKGGMDDECGGTSSPMVSDFPSSSMYACLFCGGDAARTQRGSSFLPIVILLSSCVQCPRCSTRQLLHLPHH